MKSVELPDCDLAAKHFISKTFWEQENKPPGQMMGNPIKLADGPIILAQ